MTKPSSANGGTADNSFSLDVDTFMRQSDECAYQLINGVMVIVSPREREIHRLDEVGTSIWQWLEKGSTIGQIARNLTDEYDVRAETALADATEFIDKLRQKNLIAFDAKRS